MGFWDFLKSEDQKKAERASQVNQQQQQRLSDVLRQASTKGTPAQKQAAQTYRKNAATQVAQTVSKPKQNPMDKFSDIFDANSAMDRYKRTQTNQSEWYQDQQKDLGNMRPFMNVGQAFIGNPARFLNTSAAAAREVQDTTKMLAAQVTGNEEALKNAIAENELFKKTAYDPSSGLLGAGTIFNSADEMKNIGAADLTKRVAANTIGTAGDVIPVGRGIKLAELGGKATLGATTKLVSQGAAAAGMANVGEQYVQFGKVDPKQVALAGAMGGVITGGTGLAGKVVKPAVKPTTRLVKEASNVGKPTGQALTKINSAAQNLTNQRIKLASELDNVRLRIENGDPSFRAYEANLVNQIKKVDDDLYSLDQLKSQRFNQKGAINPDEPSVIKNNLDLADTAKAKGAPVEKTPTLQDALEGKNTKLNPRNDVPLARSGQVAKAGAKQSQPLQVKPLEIEAPKQLRVKDPELTKKPLSYNNNTTLDKQAYKETFGVTDTQATKDLADIKKGTDMTKVVGNKPTKQQAKLLQSIKQDDAITKAAREAQKTGKEFNFYGKTDKTGRSVGIETFNPKTHRIEGGFVIDQDGVLLGNHIKIDETGTAISMGGRYTKMEDVFGDITKWKSQNKYTSTLERNLMEAAPDEDTGRKAVNWLVGSKTKAERQWKEAISASVSKNDARYKSVIKSKPSNVSNKQVLSDAMDYGEAKLSKSDLSTKYGKDYAKTVTDAIDGMRADYDRYIKDINDTRTRFGLEPIEPRKDYITHISELNNNKNFVGDITTSLKNSITGEAMERSRGGVPADIAGRTEGFAPSTKWNQFLQRRKGGAYEKDPFKAFNEYVPNAEHNIHMTESVVRARSAEEFLRARANLAELDSKNYGKLLSDELGQKIKGGPQDDKLVSLFQEYANSLAGKTQKLDRAILDSPLRPGLKGWQGLQRIGGRATILGNVSSVLMQPLNQLNVFATVKPKSYAKGMAKWLSGDDVINQSNFVQARVKHIDSALRGKGQKFQDAAGVPLRAVEEQSVKLAWYSNYEDVLRKGLKGKTAVLEADRLTERAVAGRGLADKPEAYRSTAINGFLQYTLEVMAQAKVFWKDLTPVQKAKWIAGAAAINTGYEMVMNDRPLPDYLNAVVEGTGVMNAEDDRNAGEKAIDTAQGLASETVKFNPITANAAQFLPKDLKTTLFGTDSDLTRFDGSAAPLRVISNAYQGAKNIAEGDMLEAAKNILKTVPMGNQAQKTLTGAGMLARGNAIDKNGNPTFDAPTSPADKARALLFGPYATDASQEYYSNQKSTKTKEAEKTAANKGTLTLDQAQANATKRIETAFGREYANLGVKELKELAKTDPQAKQAYDIWNQTTKAFGAGADTPVGLNPVAEKILNRASRTTNENWDNMKSSVGEVQTELQKWLPEGYNLPKVNNYTAKAWADYEKKLADGTLNEISADKARRDIIRAAYKSDLDDITRSFYSLGDDAMRTQLQKGTITKAQMDKVIEIDNVLTALGIQPYAQVGKTLRRELGYAAASGGSKSSGRSGGSKTKSLGMDYKLFGFGDPKNAGGQSLRKLLEKYIV